MMSQLSVFLVLVLTIINATGLSVDSSHVRGGRQMWREQGQGQGQVQGQGSVSRVSHAGPSKSFRQTNIIDSPQQQDPKPPASICKAAGFFANPESCTDFHRCVDWTGKNIRFSIFHFNCPAGTIFDNSLGICNHPWAVKRPECTGYQEPLVVHPTQGPVTSGTPKPTSSWNQTPTSSWNQETTIGSSTEFPGTNNSSSSTGPPKPFTLECKQNNKYSRHPLYCNRYYYCIWDSDTADWTFPSFTCPRDLLFDEYSQQCSNLAAPCDGILAPTEAPHNITQTPPTPSNTQTPSTPSNTQTPPTPSNTQTPPTPSNTQTPSTPSNTQTPFTTPEDRTTSIFMEIPTPTEKNWEVDPVSSYSCPAPGYYPFEGDCIRFYKCVETEEGKLKGLLYRCPNGYGYNENMQRCRKEQELPKCEKFMTEALFRLEAARPLYVEDLKWFFVN